MIPDLVADSPMLSPADLMDLAIAKARQGVAGGQSPFGCAIARGDQVLAVSHNVVWATTDITAHAEVTALREACRAAKAIWLEGAVVATTCEPCPMCMAALLWARVAKVYYGATIEDAADAGFHEVHLAATEMLARSGHPLELVPDVRRPECTALFREWLGRPDHRAY
jgi:tRNA(Arg) A34 adenosine deaminase TadA